MLRSLARPLFAGGRHYRCARTHSNVFGTLPGATARVRFLSSSSAASDDEEEAKRIRESRLLTPEEEEEFSRYDENFFKVFQTPSKLSEMRPEALLGRDSVPREAAELLHGPYVATGELIEGSVRPQAEALADEVLPPPPHTDPVLAERRQLGEEICEFLGFPKGWGDVTAVRGMTMKDMLGELYGSTLNKVAKSFEQQFEVELDDVKRAQYGTLLTREIRDSLREEVRTFKHERGLKRDPKERAIGTVLQERFRKLGMGVVWTGGPGFHHLPTIPETMSLGEKPPFMQSDGTLNLSAMLGLRGEELVMRELRREAKHLKGQLESAEAGSLKDAGGWKAEMAELLKQKYNEQASKHVMKRLLEGDDPDTLVNQEVADEETMKNLTKYKTHEAINRVDAYQEVLKSSESQPPASGPRWPWGGLPGRDPVPPDPAWMEELEKVTAEHKEELPRENEGEAQPEDSTEEGLRRSFPRHQELPGMLPDSVAEMPEYTVEDPSRFANMEPEFVPTSSHREAFVESFIGEECDADEQQREKYVQQQIGDRHQGVLEWVGDAEQEKPVNVLKDIPEALGMIERVLSEMMLEDDLLDETRPVVDDIEWDEDEMSVFANPEDSRGDLFDSLWTERTSEKSLEEFNRGDAPIEAQSSSFAVPRAECYFCEHGTDTLEPMNIPLLLKFINTNGMIIHKKHTGNCSKHQRRVARVIKRAKHLGLLSYKKGQFVVDSPYYSGYMHTTSYEEFVSREEARSYDVPEDDLIELDDISPNQINEYYAVQ